MNSNGFPYWQFHCERWLTGKIAAFDLEEQGLFLQFIMAAWAARGPFNICSTSVQRRFKKSAAWVADTVKAMLDVGIMEQAGDKYRIKFVDAQLAEMETIRGKRSGAGKASALARWGKPEDKENTERIEEYSTVLQSVTPVLNTCLTHVTPEKVILTGKGIPETLEVAIAYAETIGLSKAETEAFFDHFTANGWKVGGKSPMRDWKAALRTWKRNNAPGGQFFKSPERPLRFNERRVEPARGPRKVVRLESPEKARIAAMFASPAGIDAVLSRRAEILAEVEKAGSQQPESDVDEIIRIAGGVK